MQTVEVIPVEDINVQADAALVNQVPRPLSPFDVNSVNDILDYDWTMELQDDKTVMPLNAERNDIKLDEVDSAAASPVSHSTSHALPAMPIEGPPRKETAAGSTIPLSRPKRKASQKKPLIEPSDCSEDDEQYEDESARRASKRRKADAKDIKAKLEDPNLTPHELNELRKEARMARNRASAERTRLRRLQYTAMLEQKTAMQQAFLDRAIACLREYRAGKGDAHATDLVLTDFNAMQESSGGSGGVRRRGYLPETTAKFK